MLLVISIAIPDAFHLLPPIHEGGLQPMKRNHAIQMRQGAAALWQCLQHDRVQDRLVDGVALWIEADVLAVGVGQDHYELADVPPRRPGVDGQADGLPLDPRAEDQRARRLVEIVACNGRNALDRVLHGGLVLARADALDADVQRRRAGGPQDLRQALGEPEKTRRWVALLRFRLHAQLPEQMIRVAAVDLERHVDKDWQQKSRHDALPHVDDAGGAVGQDERHPQIHAQGE
mmetsp:Transcript_48550/g.147699  ORF Transcript_48550/g.147699 Transcript_48550/m.147699 type:complete len:232 (+) Transcript_48550:484-1179(+)